MYKNGMVIKHTAVRGKCTCNSVKKYAHMRNSISSTTFEFHMNRIFSRVKLAEFLFNGPKALLLRLGT